LRTCEKLETVPPDTVGIDRSRPIVATPIAGIGATSSSGGIPAKGGCPPFYDSPPTLVERLKATLTGSST
jgi:hypothetical protein